MRKRITSLRRFSLVIGAAFLCGMPAAYAASNNAPASIAAAAHKTAASPVVGDPAALPQGAALSPAATAQLTKRLDAMIGNTGTKVPGLGVILYRNGQEVYSHFAGNRRFLRQNPIAAEPITRDTRFRIASVSKQFTVITLMQLAEAGKLSLDDDVSRYLGFSLRNPAHPNTPITVRMLASHTSSLRDGKVYSIPPSVSVREFFTPEGRYYENGGHFAPANEAPGQYFCYANINYGLLGTIIEKVTGERFDRYQKEHILKQLDTAADYVPGNLTKRGFAKLGTIYQKKDENGTWNENGPWYGKADDYNGRQPKAESIYLQNPYAEDIQGWFSLDNYVPGTNATMLSPQGGLRISYEELTHSLELLMNGGTYRGKQILSPASIQEMLRPQWQYDAAQKNGNTAGGTLLSYGLGELQIAGDSTARVNRSHVVDLVGHNGEAFGLLSGVFFRPGTKDGFVYIMNGEAVAEDDDPRSAGTFSGNYIWEEEIMDALTEALLSKD